MPRRRSTRTLTNPPRTFDELVRQVRDALIKGQSDVDRAYLDTYRQTGRLIDAHLLANKERADYGAQVIPRLAQALETNDRLLYRCLRFVREYPILTPGSELGWSHYRLLIEVPDKQQRKALEVAARKKHWNSKELERRVRALNAIDVTPDRADTAKDVTPPKPLTPKRGTVGLHLIVARGERLAVDLGFKLYRPLDADQARRFGKGDPSTELKAGVIVRLDADGTLTPATDATKAALFTYPATIRRVVDGDTLVIAVAVRPDVMLEEKLRLRGLDCPEMDTPEGKAAKRFVEGLVAQAKSVTITTTKPDKWDRYLSDVFLEMEGGDLFLNNHLLANGHAVRMDEYSLTDWDGGASA